MQKVARAMYIVGIVLASCLIVYGVVLTIVGPIQIAAGVVEDKKDVVENGAGNLGKGIWFIISDTIALIFTIIGYKAFLRADKSVAPYVLAIIAGVIATAFSAVGGILSLVLYCRNEEAKPEEVTVEDNASETVIDAEIVEEKKDENVQ